VEAVEERLFVQLDPDGPKLAIVPEDGFARKCAEVLRFGLEAPPGFEPGMEVLQI
jgi:hypothetical protein